MTILIAESNSVETRANGPALGNIRLVINGYEFPTRSWNDFIVVVLSWWVSALLRLARNDSSQETVNFMDGPYSVEIFKARSGILHFMVFERGSRVSEIETGEAHITPFVFELTSQSYKVLDACKGQGWWSKDADTLLLSLKALEEEMRYIKE